MLTLGDKLCGHPYSCMCLYVHACACVYVRKRVRVCVPCVCVYVCVCVCVCVCICVCLCGCVFVYKRRVHVRVRVCKCARACILLCVHGYPLVDFVLQYPHSQNEFHPPRAPDNRLMRMTVTLPLKAKSCTKDSTYQSSYNR